ncbi:FAD-dependent monooxygenase [Micromonospora sp. NPDC048830]|uniref:FAD-dependent monooxygenase n=1 Tax=Micromonospora sp. NPDC048830 TaxID=3364257 RepID=UPI003716FFD5
MGISAALVVGGGIGGLAAATALARRGVTVDLVEIRDNFDVPGVGLGQPVNALRALRDIGVVDEVLAAGFKFDRLRFCDRDGRVILDYAYRFSDDTLPLVAALPREALHAILIRAARAAGCRLILDTSVTDIRDRAESVEVTLSNGHQQGYDLVAGFDGIRSRTREWMFGSKYEPAHSGYSAWRVVVARPDDVRSMDFYQGLGSKTGFMPLTSEAMYLFHICPEPEGAWYEKEELLPLLRERLQQYGGIVGDVRDTLTEQHDIIYSPLQPLLVEEPWFKGRVVLGGDAAHVFPPHMTQGAGMALEDAVVLAEEVTSPGSDVRGALGRYFSRRYERCAFVSRFARRMIDDEQRVKTPEDLLAAELAMRTQLPERLAAADRVMNQPVLASDPRPVDDSIVSTS